MEYQRDLVGYGAKPPDPKWPGGARLALNFVINYEEGSEANILDGETFTETGLTEGSTAQFPAGARNLAAESMITYSNYRYVISGTGLLAKQLLVLVKQMLSRALS